jgi:iron complex outermembrane recepter protein
VPVSVSALTSDDLRRQNITGLKDLATKVPGFSYEALSPAIVQPSIRGQTNLRVDSPVQNVAFYIDGIYLQRGYLVDQRLVEVERVEVLKGPQSALYGRNAFAGAVNMVSRTPDLDDLTGRISGTIGNHERYEARGWVSVPVIPGKLAVLGAAAHSEFDGTWRNNHPLADADGALTKGRLGGYRNRAYQARVLFRPFEALTLDALYIHTKRREDSAPTYSIATSGTFAAFNTLNASPRPGLTPPFAVQNRLFVGKLPTTVIVNPADTRLPGLLIDPRSFGLRGPTDVVSAKATFAPGGPFEATYQFGYTEAAITGRGSVSNNPLAPLILFGFNYGAIFDASGSGSSFKGYSHDLRVTWVDPGPIRAFVGINYARTKDINSNISEFGPVNQIGGIFAGSAFPVGPGLPFPSFTPATPQFLLARFAFYQRKEDIISPYAFVSWRPSDAIELSAEGRYTHEDHVGTDFLTREPTNPTIQALRPPRFFDTISYFTPRFTATYKVTPDNNVYASVAKGVKAGNFNTGFRFAGQATYKSESNWTYEVGTKNRFGPLQLNLAAFYTDWKDLQTGVVRLEASGLPPASFVGSVPSQVGNIKGVNVYGAEIEALWQATRQLRFNLGASYNRARYKDGSFSQRFGASGNCDGVVCQTITVAGQPTPVVDVSGNQLERVPDFNGVAGFNFSDDFGADNSWFIQGDVTYKSKQYMDEANLSFVPSRALVNASAGVTMGPFELTAWIKNAFDKKYVSTAFFLIGTSGALSATYTPVLGERRTFGLTGSFGF